MAVNGSLCGATERRLWILLLSLAMSRMNFVGVVGEYESLKIGEVPRESCYK